MSNDPCPRCGYQHQESGVRVINGIEYGCTCEPKNRREATEDGGSSHPFGDR